MAGDQGAPAARETVAVPADPPVVPMEVAPPGMAPDTGGHYGVAEAISFPARQSTMPEGRATRVTVRPLPAPLYLPNSPIRLGHEERILRQYAAVKVRRRKSGEGILYVTDSRIVFYARAQGRGTQRPSAIMAQTKISEISGVSAYIFRRFALGYIIGAIFFGIVGLISLVTYPFGAILSLLICAAFILALIGGAAHRGGTGVQIFSSSQEGAAVGFGRLDHHRGLIGQLTHTFTGPITSIFGVYTVWDVVNGMPSEHSDLIISELGALILDLQTRGDLVFEHYGAGIVPAHEPQLPYGQV
jgi:hypothetical protein